MPRKGRIEDGVYRREFPIPDDVAKRSREDYTVDQSGCWIAGKGARANGYRSVYGKHPETGRQVSFLAHRASWTLDNGPIPAGMVIDHKCFNRACINPDHLRLLTPAQNVQRSKGRDFPLGQCPWGHDEKYMTLYHYPSRDQRVCSECHKWRNGYITTLKSTLRVMEQHYGISLTRRQREMVREFAPEILLSTSSGASDG